MSNSNNKFDDDFDDFYGDDGDGVNMFSNESTRAEGNIFPIGYQDGLEDGKNQTLQLGFNEGLKESSEIAYKWSLLIGAISSLDVFFHHNNSLLTEEHAKLVSSLENMQSRLKSILNLHCSPPTIDTLKYKFNNYTHTHIHTDSKTTSCNSINQSTSNSNSNCCGGSGDCDKEESTSSCVTGDNLHDCSDKDGCCGGRGEDGGCCKTSSPSLPTAATPSPSTLTTSTTQNKLNIQEDTELFDKLCGECKEIFNQFGLDGSAIISNCLEKQFKVINTQN